MSAQAAILKRTGPARAQKWRPRLPVSTTIAGVYAVLIVVAVLVADVLKPLDTTTVEFAAFLQPPSASHPMGTDELGRDVFARVLHGLRVSLVMAAGAAVAAACIGGTLGLIAGTFGGKVDAVVMRFVDFYSSQSHLLFGILLVTLFRPVFGPVGAVLLSVGLTHWPTLARIIRGELLSLRENVFVSAAINGGAGHARLARRHYLPHLLPAGALGFVLLFPHAIFHESALSFLGLGLPPAQASLGNLLADSQRALLIGGWWTSLFPGLAIFTMSLAVGTLGEYWRDRLHPRWRSEMEL